MIPNDLKHLTSAQHENFERNPANFKEIDEFVNDRLNFQKFLGLKDFISTEKLLISNFQFFIESNGLQNCRDKDKAKESSQDAQNYEELSNQNDYQMYFQLKFQSINFNFK